MEAKKLIEVAAREIGYIEKANKNDLDLKKSNAGDGNFTKYARDLFPDLQGQPWCDMFVDWCFYTAFGKERALELLYKFNAWTPGSAEEFKKRGQYFKEPQFGDIIFFKNSKRIYHTGIVYGVYNDHITTIEGNTSNTINSVVANGGEVCLKSYKLNNPNIDGYARPKYNNITYIKGWNKDDRGWWYAYGTQKGEFHKNNAVRIDGELYFFDVDGYCVMNPNIETKLTGELLYIKGKPAQDRN